MITNSIGGYDVEVDSIDETKWGELLSEFNDANIHQTWSEGKVCSGEKNLSRLVLKRDGETVGMAQISIKKISIIRAGIATVYWGPLWRKKCVAPDYDILDTMIESLKNEYVIRRALLLRIWPVDFEGLGKETVSILKKHGFIRNQKVSQYRTLLLDITPPTKDLRKNLAQKWRNQLNRAEKNNLVITEGSSDEMFLDFLKILNETVTRKNFTSGADYDRYRRIQNDLPEHLKMNNFICTYEGEPVSGGVFSGLGGTGTYLLGATANKGLKLNGSNLIHWRVIQWLKESGCKWYDLGGIDPDGNPGVYHFKRGLAGKSGREATHLGQYYLAANSASYLLNTCINQANAVRTRLTRRQ